MAKVYARVCVDPYGDEWCTVAVRQGCSVGEVMGALGRQGVNVRGMSIAHEYDTKRPVSYAFVENLQE